MKLNLQFSVYIDLIRIIAALFVFFEHLPGAIGGLFWQLSGFGHEAVVVFFVLSGYVISYVAINKEKDPLGYIVSRISRIYSVAIPALVLTIFLYYLGNYIDSDAFANVNVKQKNPIITIVSALLFINESWWQVPIFINFPYWSLGYEVLYYVFFGLCYFVRGPKKIIYVIFVLALMGPRILLYLPVWWLGVCCYRLSLRFYLSKIASCVLYILSLILIIILCSHQIGDVVNRFFSYYIYDVRCLKFLSALDSIYSDYFIAIAVFLNLFSFYFLGLKSCLFSERSIKTIRIFSSYTFSMYLYHFPILYFFSVIFPYFEFPIINLLCCTVLTITIIVFLGNYTERRKYYIKKICYSLIGMFKIYK